MRDSNPRKRSQSPVCYRYTNPLNGLLPKRMIIITISRKKSRLIFSFLQKLKPGGTGLCSDYMKPAVRMAALMEVPVKFIWTHDAFRVGEDTDPCHEHHEPLCHHAELLRDRCAEKHL